MPSSIAKCEYLNRKKQELGLDNLIIEVDGGVKVDNIKRIADAGANMFVAGSAIFGSDDYKDVISKMRSQLGEA
jgi:ribulose-phosphate 3-epimerase